MRQQPNPAAVVGDGWGQWGPNHRTMCVQQVSDIEENIWAPKFGLKGMIDASLHIGLGPEVSPFGLLSACLPSRAHLFDLRPCPSVQQV